MKVYAVVELDVESLTCPTEERTVASLKQSVERAIRHVLDNGTHIQDDIRLQNRSVRICLEKP